MKIPEEYIDPNKKRIQRPPPSNRRSCIILSLVLLVLTCVLGIAAIFIFWLPGASEDEQWCLEQYGMPCLEVAEYIDSFLYDGTEKEIVMEAINSVSPDTLRPASFPNGFEEDQLSECYDVVFNEDRGWARWWRTFCFDSNGRIVYARRDYRSDFAPVHFSTPTQAP